MKAGVCEGCVVLKRPWCAPEAPQSQPSLPSIRFLGQRTSRLSPKDPWRLSPPNPGKRSLSPTFAPQHSLSWSEGLTPLLLPLTLLFVANQSATLQCLCSTHESLPEHPPHPPPRLSSWTKLVCTAPSSFLKVSQSCVPHCELRTRT